MYLLTEWEGRTGKYLARDQDVRTDLTQSISILSYDHFFSFSFFGGTRPRAAALLRFESSDFLSVASL